MEKDEEKQDDILYRLGREILPLIKNIYNLIYKLIADHTSEIIIAGTIAYIIFG